MKKEELEGLIEMFVKEVKKLPLIEKEVAVLLGRISEGFTPTGDWKKDYQTVSELELNAKKMLEVFEPLTETPVGVEDAFIQLKRGCEQAKEVLAEKRPLGEKDAVHVEVNRRNLASRVSSFMKSLEEKERKDLKRIIEVLEENRGLKRENRELKEKLRKMKKTP